MNTPPIKRCSTCRYFVFKRTGTRKFGCVHVDRVAGRKHRMPVGYDDPACELFEMHDPFRPLRGGSK